MESLSLPLWYARNAIRSTRKQRRPSTVDPEIGSANKLAVEIIFFSSLSPLFSSGVTVTGTTRSCLRSATRLPPRDPPFFAATLRIYPCWSLFCRVLPLEIDQERSLKTFQFLCFCVGTGPFDYFKTRFKSYFNLFSERNSDPTRGRILKSGQMERFLRCGQIWN